MKIVNNGLLFITCLAVLSVKAQQHRGNWDTYVMQIDQRPASVVVDLDFGHSPEAKAKTNVIVVQLQLQQVLADGMPQRSEVSVLDSIENALEKQLADALGASYTGRYTRDGLRTFYFYSNDTSSCRRSVALVLAQFPAYTWDLKINSDTGLSYYQHVLYPTQQEWERIKNRRMVDALQAKGDRLTAARKVDHYFYFKTESDRKSFARIVQDSGFVVENAGKEMGIRDKPYSLHISRTDKVDSESMDKVTIFLWKLALHYFGKYDGWETFVVR